MTSTWKSRRSLLITEGHQLSTHLYPSANLFWQGKLNGISLGFPQAGNVSDQINGSKWQDFWTQVIWVQSQLSYSCVWCRVGKRQAASTSTSLHQAPCRPLTLKKTCEFLWWPGQLCWWVPVWSPNLAFSLLTLVAAQAMPWASFKDCLLCFQLSFFPYWALITPLSAKICSEEKEDLSLFLLVSQHIVPLSSFSLSHNSNSIGIASPIFHPIFYLKKKNPKTNISKHILVEFVWREHLCLQHHIQCLPFHFFFVSVSSFPC